MSFREKSARVRVGFFVLFAFVIAEIVNYTARIIYCRRGSQR